MIYIFLKNILYSCTLFTFKIEINILNLNTYLHIYILLAEFQKFSVKVQYYKNNLWGRKTCSLKLNIQYGVRFLRYQQKIS